MKSVSVRSRRPGESGQAVVEAVITLPLVIFVVLGILQLFMMLQARIVAQYAAYKAVRVGALSKGNCLAMTQAAATAMLPVVTRTDSQAAFLWAFNSRAKNGVPYYTKGGDGFDGPIVQIVRERPQLGDILGGGQEDVDFDDFTRGSPPYDLEIHMAAWYHMRIPFANWVMSRIFMARYALMPPPNRNPYLPVQKNLDWSTKNKKVLEADYYPGVSLASRMMTLAGQGQYVFPIQVSASMPMMTPPSKTYFSTACP